MHSSNFRSTRSLFVVFAFLGLSACGSLSKGAAHTSQDSLGTIIKSSNDTVAMGDKSGSKEAYKPLTGRMDGVEYYINQELADAGMDSEKVEFPELESAFENGSRSWRPGRGFNIPYVKHPRVQHWIQVFNGPLRPRFEQWIRRGSYLVPFMEKILREHDVPTDLVYLSMIESGFNPNAYSHAHAAGLWQFIPSTGRLYGLDSSGLVDERRDLIKSTKAAASHLRDLYKMYGDWHLAFAAYNAGPGSVNRAMRRSGMRSYWKMTEGNTRFFRQETKDYVPRIIAAATIVKDYKKYGYSSKIFERPLDFDVVTVKDSVDLKSIAKCARASLEEVQYLNPSLIYGVTPPGKSYTVLVPGGTKGIFERNYAKLPKMAAPKVQMAFHKVKKKETLASIARRHGMSASKLASANNLKVKSRLQAGMTLSIPKQRFGSKVKPINDRPAIARSRDLFDTEVASADEIEEDEITEKLAAQAAESEGRPEVAAAAAAVEAPERANGAAVDAPQADSDEVQVALTAETGPAVSAMRTHSVKRGDTLSGIAQQYGVKVAQLKEWNRIGARGVLRPGQIVRVGAPKVAAAAKPSNRDRLIIHSVRNGETLWVLAKKYRVSVTQLKNWNRLSGNHLYPKQKIRIYAANASGGPAGKKVAFAQPQ